MRALASVAFLVLAWLGPLAAPPARADGCRFALGFQTLHDRLAAVVGSCVGDEQHSTTTADATQQTTRGLLVWRKADNVAAFTDGRRTWLDGPDGLQERPNAARFAWEVAAGGGPALLGPVYAGLTSVPATAQQHVLSCEAAASALALRLDGYPATEADILADLPADARQPVIARGTVRQWGDPNLAFVGRIDGWFPWTPGAAKAGTGTHGWGYGVYAGPVLQAVRAIDPAARGGTGIALAALEAGLRQGRPAVVWLPDQAYYRRDRARALRTGQWTGWDGAPVTYALDEHAQVVLGYDGSHVLVADVGYRATHSQFLSIWLLADFERAYAVLHDMAVIP